MIRIRRGFGDEKSQLRDLNNRLDQYLSRVRELEKENQLLVEEIHKLRLEQGARWSHGYHSEICQLRMKVEELTVEKCEAEIQKENLWQELQMLQELWDQVRAMRISIDQQLALYKEDLHKAKSSQAALEELYLHLQQECQVLQGSHQEELLAITDQVLKIPMHVSIQETLAPRLSIQDIQSISLELSESWKDAFLLYQKKIEELENHLRLSEEERQGVEEEVRVYSLQVVELRREYEELLGIRKTLEDELLRMKERYRLEVEEYQIIIEELEQERQTVTITITERLKDYHELMQLKTGLSLEVAAYRALLEGENQKGRVIWTDFSEKEIPAGHETPAFPQSARYSSVMRGEDRKEFLNKRIHEDIRIKTQTSDIHRLQAVPKIQIRKQATDLGRANSSYVSRIHERTIQEKSGRLNTSFQPRYGLLKNRDIHHNVYDTALHTVVAPHSSSESKTSLQKTKVEQVNNLKPGATPSAMSDIVNKDKRDARVGDKINQSHYLESEVVVEREATNKSVEEQKRDVEDSMKTYQTEEVSVKNTNMEGQTRKENTASITVTEEKETIKEPKMQELPVKKERKKRDQAKKKREEIEKVGVDAINITETKNVLEQRSVSVKTIIPENNIKEGQAPHEIPIQFEAIGKEDCLQKISVESTKENQTGINSSQTYETEALNTEFEHVQNIEKGGSEASKTKETEVVITSSEHLGGKAMVADILKHFGQPADLDDAEVTYVERKQVGSDGTMRTEIIVQSKTEEDVDIFDEPDLADLWSKKSYKTVEECLAGAAEYLAEDEQNRKFTKTIQGEVEEEEAEWIGNVIQTGLKGRKGLSVNVEIIEESIGTFGGERAEFSTPFHVEEAEDSSHTEEVASDEKDLHSSGKSEGDKVQLSEVPTHVEEVVEGEEVDEETSYFVSIPDDIPREEDDEEETIKGQIHIEEESHVKYSWQDEFLQSSQGRKTLSEYLKYTSSNEPGTSSSVYRQETHEPKEEVTQTETVVIEKEIKIPQGFQSSIKGLLSKESQDPQQKLKGALDCLQESLPQDIVEELSTLAGGEQTQTSSFAVDIKKVDQTKESGIVTIVAEINVSQTMDTGDAETLHILEKVKNEDGLLAHSTMESCEGKVYSKDRPEGESLPGTIESETDKESVFMETNVSKVIDREPDTKNIHLNETGKVSQSQIVTDVGRLIKHMPADADNEQLSIGVSRTDKEHVLTGEESLTDTNRSFHHIKLGPKEVFSTQQIIFEGPVSETLKLDIVNSAEDSSNQNRSVHHIKISPTEMYPTEQIIFQGPIFKTTSSSATGDLTLSEKPTENINETTEKSNLDFSSQQAGGQVNEIIFQTEAAGTKKTITHFKLNSGETQLSKEIVFEGCLPNIVEHSRHVVQETRNLEDNSMPVEHSVGSQKIHTAQKIKYQGFISQSYQVGSDDTENQSNVSTSVHHIQLSPNKEQIIFEGPISENLDIGSAVDDSHFKDSNRSIAHIRLGAKEITASEHITFEIPSSETYESSDFVVSSPSGDSNESEKSIKHIKLGPTEKSFTFQMDITKVATKYQGEAEGQESRMVITSRNVGGQPKISETDDPEVAESGYGEEEIAGGSQYPYEAEIQSKRIIDTSEFDKTIQMHRIVHQGSGVSDDKKVAVVYLEEDEEADHDYLRRSF
ncbi:synemin [Spea bombifrons]|uniref:synemin n=1 Tax=Spea bombifrons TaxID=233779 RepID=UPI0023491514|nr:synemin [Spea bombifrons]